MKTIVISQGFISTYLIKILKELGHQVTVFHHDDKIVIKEADYIFYTSSYGNHYHQKDQATIFKSNVYDYLKLLRDTKDIPYKCLFYFSSSSVTLPVQTDYSDAKFIGEILSRRFVKKFKKPIICIRPASVWGIGEAPWRLMPTAINNVLDGKDMPITVGYHDWIYVEDFVDGLIKVMENAHKVIGKSIPIGTAKQTSNHEILGMIMKITKKAVKLVESDAVKRKFDTKNWISNNEIIRSFGWKQKYTVEQGLQKMIDNYVANRLKKTSH